MGREVPRISVVVPVYNVVPYLERCLTSLAAQTYANMEVILVDDASTDGGGSICDAWASKDSRFQVLHLPRNQGVSAARNQGVRRASGDYIAFADSDDFVEPGLLTILYRTLRENRGDISICGDEGMGLRPASAGVLSREETARCLARRSPFLWVPWGKLFPAELAREIPFDSEALCCEDLLFFYQVLQRVDRIAYVPDPLYHYAYRQGSAVNGGITEKRCTVLSVLDGICQDAAAHLPEVLDSFRQIAMNTAVRLAMQAVEDGTPEGALFGYLKRFQGHVRRHFTWKALALRPGKKDAAAELLLYVSAAAFYGAGAALCRIKGTEG